MTTTNNPTTNPTPSPRSEELFDALTLLAEHDEEGRFGEKCDGEYECVCDDDFKPYKVIATFTAERLNDLIIAQNNAKYEAVMELLKDEKLIVPDFPRTDDDGEPLYSKRASAEGRKQVIARYHARNQLRAELRQSIDKIFGKESSDE